MHIQDVLNVFESKIETLKRDYEQYFLGILKRPPEKLQKEVDQIHRRITPHDIRNTAMRFRFQQLVARLVSYNQYWTRTMLQIEAGTYKRDLFRAKLHANKTPSITKPSIGKVVDTNDLTPNTIDRLYQNYIDAKTQCGEPTKNLSKELFEKALNKNSQAMIKQNKAVNFRVAIEDGKAKIKISSTK